LQASRLFAFSAGNREPGRLAKATLPILKPSIGRAGKLLAPTEFPTFKAPKPGRADQARKGWSADGSVEGCGFGSSIGRAGKLLAPTEFPTFKAPKPGRADQARKGWSAD
jgi:hypothetical protein